jgi:hypothetical protein
VDRDTFTQLLSEQGQAALAEATALLPRDETFLSDFKRLSKSHSAELARAALETVLLRQRGRSKFVHADRMYFTREALEQASGEVIANWRARRLSSCKRIGDFCCGIGGDTIGLSTVADIIAIDADPLRLAMAEQNLIAYNRRDRVAFIEQDLMRLQLPNVDAIFLDPGRRGGGRRTLSVRECEPPLDIVENWKQQVPAIGVKLAPAVDLVELAPYDGETEFVSVDGELKECVLWLGPLRTASRRATVLPAGETMIGEDIEPPPRPGQPGEWLAEPDPAVIRAGLVRQLARQLDAWQLDADIAYLAASTSRPTPFARWFRIEASLPFQLKRLRELLRARHIGRLTVKRRGSPIDPATLIRQLKLDGPHERVLILTHVAGRPWAMIGTPAAIE